MAAHNTFAFMEAASYKLKPVLSKFEACCSPQKNIVYKCYNFCKSTQAPGEPIDAFVISLLQKVKSTDFGAQTVSLIRDRVVLGCPDERLQERLLREPELYL